MKTFKQYKDWNYEINKEGVVRNIETGRILSGSVHGKYWSFCLLDPNGKRVNIKRATLIGEVFKGFVPDGGITIVHHMDEDTLNDSFNNLKVTTQRNNVIFSLKGNKILPIGVHPSFRKKNPYRAVISIKGKNKYLGNYHTVEEAKGAYNRELNKIV